jgi:predicted RNase H-like nuclease
LYKRPEAVHVRDAIVTGLVNEARIMVSTDVRAQLVAIHDALDPLVCALVARAARLGLTSRPAEGAEIESARREGWIHTPSADALERLSGG